jgi:pimeloyl-ACP methyl ester carboxylesterase
MKVRIAAVSLVVLVVALLGNAFLVDRAERRAAPFAGGRVLDLDGPDLNVRDYGPPGDRAVVLLHGYSASIEWWHVVASALADTGLRVIAIDLVGHGGSEAPRDAKQYGATGQAAAVHLALRALGVHRMVLVGHSMGGDVATAIAESDPEEVERVVVSDTPGDRGLVNLPLLGSLACWPLIGPAVDRFRGVDAITDGSLQTGFAPGYPVPEFAHRSLEQLTHTGLCDSHADEELNSQRAVADRLAGLGKPVRVIWGERDVLTPTAANVDRYRAAGLTPLIIAGSGHSPMVEKPDAFVAAISDFIRAK